MEFVLIIALVLLLMIAALFVVTEYAFKSGQDIAASQMQQIGRTITDQSREVYYLGLFSQQILSFNVPEGVESMQTLAIKRGDTYTENYFIATMYTSGTLVNFSYPAEVPLVGNDCMDTVCGANPCTRCMFRNTDYSSGRKDFKLETIAWKGGYAVNITRVFI